MPPVDPIPSGDEMVRRLPERKFPPSQPAGPSPADDAATDISQRPSLPEHPEPMAADLEDEDADPVSDSGPGIADGAHSLNKQRG